MGGLCTKTGRPSDMVTKRSKISDTGNTQLFSKRVNTNIKEVARTRMANESSERTYKNETESTRSTSTTTHRETHEVSIQTDLVDCEMAIKRGENMQIIVQGARNIHFSNSYNEKNYEALETQNSCDISFKGLRNEAKQGEHVTEQTLVATSQDLPRAFDVQDKESNTHQNTKGDTFKKEKTKKRKKIRTYLTRVHTENPQEENIVSTASTEHNTTERGTNYSNETVSELQKQNDKLEKKLDKKNKKITKQETRIKKKEEKMSTLKQKINDVEEKLRILENEHDRCNRADLHKTETAINQTKRNLEEELRRRGQEIEELKLRLSHIMAVRLTDNNPNIADLSDMNRPTKIADRFSELYDNQWTNSFETITVEYKMSEKEAITCLFNTVKLPDDHLLSLKVFKESRKKNFKTLLYNLNRKVHTALEQVFPNTAILSDEHFEEYSSLATELCWLMCIQDPPVVMVTDCHPGDRFDKTLFREYHTKGKRYAFCVWPAVLLHEGGGVLCKGVAQPMSTNKQPSENVLTKAS